MRVFIRAFTPGPWHLSGGRPCRRRDEFLRSGNFVILPEGEMPRGKRCDRCLPEECPRCNSDTCPGILDILDCTALVNGLSAHDEDLARKRGIRVPRTDAELEYVAEKARQEWLADRDG